MRIIKKEPAAGSDGIIRRSDANARILGCIKRNKLFFLFSACLILLFCLRLMFTISSGDEVFNLAQGYRITLGQKMFVEIWDLFQTGDSFLVPFIWLFVKITGGTDGIVIFSRYVYLFLNILLAVAVYQMLKNIIDRKILLCTGIFLITYAPFSLYYLWYDTCMLLFMLLGLILVIAYLNSGKRSLLLYAGVTHALMCYSYPTTLPVYCFIAILLIVYKRVQKESFKETVGSVKFYIIGAAGVFAVFAGYVLIMGVGNMFFTDAEIMQSTLTGRTGSVFSAVFNAFMASATFFSFSELLVTLAVMIVAFCNRKRQNNYVWAFVLLYILISSVLFNFGGGTLALLGFFFYLSLWAPALYLCIDKNQLPCKIKNQLFIFLWLPAVISTACVGYTALGHGPKTIMGMYTGAVCSFIYLLVIAKGLTLNIRKNHFNIMKPMALLLVCINLLLFCLTSFLYIQPKDCRYQMKSGVFKGLMAQAKDSKLEKMETILENAEDEKDKTIMCSETMKWCYLATDLKHDAAFLWAPHTTVDDRNSYEMTFLFFDKYYGLPDIIVWSQEDKKDMTEGLLSVLNDNYEITYENPDEFIIYKLK